MVRPTGNRSVDAKEESNPTSDLESPGKKELPVIRDNWSESGWACTGKEILFSFITRLNLQLYTQLKIAVLLRKNTIGFPGSANPRKAVRSAFVSYCHRALPEFSPAT